MKKIIVSILVTLGLSAPALAFTPSQITSLRALGYQIKTSPYYESVVAKKTGLNCSSLIVQVNANLFYANVVKKHHYEEYAWPVTADQLLGVATDYSGDC